MPIKLFINCKNSKRKEDKKHRSFGDKINSGNVSAADDHHSLSHLEIITREEVYFTGKENIEGYACLVNVFLKSLLNSSSNPGLINIDNAEEFDESKIRLG